MTSSRSKASTSRLLAALVVLCAVLGVGGVAQAGRKRVVVLEFEGPKGEKFHDDVVRLIKKTHTVVPIDKWNGVAEELGAGTLSEKNLKKVAKKLKIDAIVEGKIEKRRDEFIIRLKLHIGKTGELFGSPIGTKAEGPRIDGKAQRDLKDELVDAIDNVESNHGGSVEDEEAEDKPAKKSAKKPAVEDEEAEDKPVKRGFSRRLDDERGADKVDKKTAKKPAAEDDEDAPPAKKPAAKPVVEDEDKLPPRKLAAKAEDEDKLPPRKLAAKADDDDKLPPRRVATKTDDEDKLPPRKLATKPDAADDAADEDDDEPRKKVASRDADSSTEVSTEAPRLGAAEALSPGERAVDAIAGLSVTARRLSFVTRPGFTAQPPGYSGNPVGGAMLDVTVYPLALAHTRRDQLKNIGIELMYDRVLKIDSKDQAGKVLDTKSSRWSLGGVFRYPLSRSASAPVVGGTLAIGSQIFRISQAVDIPSVKYSIIEPGALVRVPLLKKLVVGADAKLMIITDTGQLQDQMHYGTTTLYGFEGSLGADYMITRNIFARAAFRFETIRFTFEGNGALTTGRDGDPATADVKSGSDTYFGGFLTAGYAY